MKKIVSVSLTMTALLVGLAVGGLLLSGYFNLLTPLTPFIPGLSILAGNPLFLAVGIGVAVLGSIAAIVLLLIRPRLSRENRHPSQRYLVISSKNGSQSTQGAPISSEHKKNQIFIQKLGKERDMLKHYTAIFLDKAQLSSKEETRYKKLCDNLCTNSPISTLLDFKRLNEWVKGEANLVKEVREKIEWEQEKGFFEEGDLNDEVAVYFVTREKLAKVKGLSENQLFQIPNLALTESQIASYIDRVQVSKIPPIPTCCL